MYARIHVYCLAFCATRICILSPLSLMLYTSASSLLSLNRAGWTPPHGDCTPTAQPPGATPS
jgi:hypothetical protein